MKNICRCVMIVFVAKNPSTKTRSRFLRAVWKLSTFQKPSNPISLLPFQKPVR